MFTNRGARNAARRQVVTRPGRVCHQCLVMVNGTMAGGDDSEWFRCSGWGNQIATTVPPQYCSISGTSYTIDINITTYCNIVPVQHVLLYSY